MSHEANTAEAQDASPGEDSVVIDCEACGTTFDSREGFGWAAPRTGAQIEFYCATCRPRWDAITEATHTFADWIHAVRGERGIGDAATDEVQG